jgi:hypothetical protein
MTVTNDVSARVRVVDPGALRFRFVTVRVTVAVAVWPSAQ